MHRVFILAALLAASITGGIYAQTCPPTLPAPGPLQVSTNTRYFATPDNKAVYLTGAHTWTGAFGFASLGPFSFTAYVNYLTTLNQNFLRYWNVWDENPDGPWHNNVGAVIPLPFNRSGSCCAADGGNKYNVSSFNQSYFDSLKTNVQYAASHGMYVMVMLFFDTDYVGGASWATNYWNGLNNINGTTTDVTQIETGSNGTTLALQHAYAQKVMDTLATERNVLYEIANEPEQSGNGSGSGVHTFQEDIIGLIHSYEIAQGYMHHPVGAEYSPTFLAGTAADFVIPYVYLGNPPVYTFGKPVFADTDHYFGFGGGTDWWWQSFMNGNNMLSMDDMRGTGLSGNLDLGSPAEIPQNRAAITQTRTLTALVDMTGIAPSGGISSSNYALANTAAHQYMVYVPAAAGGSVTVDLSSASGVALRARWLSTTTGLFGSTTNLTGGSGAQGFTSPFGSTAAALLITP